MLRKGQSTLEYIYLLAIVAAAIIAMLVYMKRGFQGNVRSQSEQLGAGSYSPGNTTASSAENKGLESEIVSTSTNTITYGSSHRYTDEILTLKAETKALQDEVNVLATQLHSVAKYSAAWETLMEQLSSKQETLSAKQKELNIAMRKWQLEEKTADKTVSSSANTETGTEKTTRQASESLGADSSDKWGR